MSLFRVLPGRFLEGPFGPKGSPARYPWGGSSVDLTPEQFEQQAGKLEPLDAEAGALHAAWLKRVGLDGKWDWWNHLPRTNT